MAEDLDRAACLSILRAKANMAVLMDAAPYFEKAAQMLEKLPAADVAPVVRCHDCINAEPLERNCELNANFYMHCRLWRGEECKNVWHKYKRYYRDYSLVEHGDFCSHGERKDGGEHVE